MADYYDIDQILMEEERVPTTFNIDAFNLGYLDPSTDSPDLDSGTTLELPLWLATSLVARSLVEVTAPRMYAGRTMAALDADPTVVALRDKGQFYYEVGLELAAMTKPRQPQLAGVLRKVLAKRYTQILDVATNSLGQDTSTFTRQLTALERDLFQDGYTSTSSLYYWKTRQLEKLKPSIVTRQPTKRKRSARS